MVDMTFIQFKFQVLISFPLYNVSQSQLPFPFFINLFCDQVVRDKIKGYVLIINYVQAGAAVSFCQR